MRMDLRIVAAAGTVAVLGGAGCSEYDLGGTGEPDTKTSETSTDTVTTTWTDTETETDPGDECDGVDNDGDGLVDEGHPDIDGDGLADCVDDGCEVALADADTTIVRKECLSYDPDEIADPWNVNLEWTYTLSGASVVSPVTGQLTDDNGDGVIDDADTPDIAYTSYSDGALYIVSGDGSGLVCSQTGWRTDGGVIIADVDGDGVNEVAGPINTGHVRAVDGACNTEWQTTQTYSFLYPITTAADLDGDGIVEVIADTAVVDGRNGAHVATLSPANASCWRAPFTGDLDQDGDTEIVLGDTVFDGAGNVVWSVTGTGTSCFGGLVNIDGDPQAEVVISYGSSLGVYEHDGALAWSASLAVSNPGPPCAGDIDGDDEVEIVVPNGTALTAFEANGASKWSSTMSDSSGGAGCVVFDMNGDEIYEVLFADEVALRLYDGSTGAVLWEDATHDSVTYFETPTVADVDNDGSAEMLVVNSSFGGSTVGLTVFGHNGSGWPAAGPTWGLHDFSATNQNPDGTIPSNPTAPWLAYNVFRGRPFDDVPGAPNLSAEETDLCVSSCDPEVGMVSVSYQVTNDGGNDAATSNASLYLVDGSTELLFATQPIPAIAAGEVAVSGVFEVPVSKWTGEYLIRVDDDGLGLGVLGECYEDDNELQGTANLCP